jgi:thiamine-phosphate pyrophosphorylase
MNGISRRFLYHLITDHKQYKQPLHEAARLAEMHHVTHFQLREKEMAKAELLELARHIRPALEHTRFIVNGHLDVALASEADGVHLQAGNIPISVVRQKYPDLLIGYSAHTREEILQAEASGADYVLLGPVYAPLSKSGNISPLGLETFCEWIAGTKIPVFALGGLDASNLRTIEFSGCCGAAGISLFIRDGHFTASGMVIQ